MKRSRSSTGKRVSGKPITGKPITGKRSIGESGKGQKERHRRKPSQGAPSKRRTTMRAVAHGKALSAPLQGPSVSSKSPSGSLQGPSVSLKSSSVPSKGPSVSLKSKSSTNQTKSSRPGERLQKVLAAAGVASRRECEQLMLEGRVEVDGQVVVELGTKVDQSCQEIRVDGESVTRPKRVYYAVHKPTGVVCTARDPAGRPRVIDMLPESEGRVFNVGRLDINSEGLILVTNDGALADQLTHPRYGIEKTYEVFVQGHPDRAVLDKLRKGVHLAEGFAQVVSVRIKKRLKNTTALEMVLDEGRNREVRRLLARVGHKVQRLVRIAIGPIRLGEMPPGTIRKLAPQEVDKIRNAAVAGTRKEGRGARSAVKRKRGTRSKERATRKR